MSVNVNHVPENIFDIYEKFKASAMKKGQINKNASEENIQKGFMDAIADPKVKNYILNMINEIPVLGKQVDVYTKVQFLKDNGVEIELDGDPSVSSMKRYVDKQLRKFENQKYQERDVKNKELQKKLDDALKLIKSK